LSALLVPRVKTAGKRACEFDLPRSALRIAPGPGVHTRAGGENTRVTGRRAQLMLRNAQEGIDSSV